MFVASEHIAATRYPATRLAMHLGAIDLDDNALVEHLAEIFPEASADQVESFMKTLNKIGKSIAPIAKQVVPVLQQVAPGAIQGAVTGAAAGPKGALIGAGIGAVASLLAKPPGGQQPASPAAVRTTAPAPAALPTTQPITRQPVTTPRSLPPPTPLPPQQSTPRPQAVGVALPPGSQAAIGQLLALLARPETLRAISALALGNRGRTTVPVGNRQVPVAAFANAIAEYATQVSDAIEPSREAELDAYHQVADGIDIADSQARANALLQALLREPV